MRILLSVFAAAALLLGSAPAQAFNITFGAVNNLSSCSTGGNTGDRNCSSSASVNNGALDATASASVVGQASADHGITTNPDAFADITVTYDIPYTITRTVTVASLQMSIPVLSLTFNATFNGSTGYDSSQVGGGAAFALADPAALSDSGGANLVFGTTNYAGSSAGGTSGGPTFSTFNVTSPDPSASLTANYQGSAGEVNLFAEVPTNFRDWTDAVAPFANGGSFPDGNYITQTYSDTIRVSFRLRAESRPQGSVSTTGGEALACAGQTSPLGGFDLDDGGGNCGTGFGITATLAQTGTTQFTVPEPATLSLLGVGLFGLGWATRRIRKD